MRLQQCVQQNQIYRNFIWYYKMINIHEIPVIWRDHYRALFDICQHFHKIFHSMWNRNPKTFRGPIIQQLTLTLRLNLNDEIRSELLLNDIFILIPRHFSFVFFSIKYWQKNKKSGDRGFFTSTWQIGQIKICELLNSFIIASFNTIDFLFTHDRECCFQKQSIIRNVKRHRN